MKKFFLPIAMLVMAALAFGQEADQEGTFCIVDFNEPVKYELRYLEEGMLCIVGVEDAPNYVDKSGFSGYGWGTRWAFIVLSMEDENYELLYGDSATQKDLWYRASINGEDLKIVYYFENGILASGMWVIDDVDQPSFWVINEYLQDSYDSNVELTVKNDNWIEAEMFPPGTNSWIIHNLDVEENSHTVHYYYRRGDE